MRRPSHERVPISLDGTSVFPYINQHQSFTSLSFEVLKVGVPIYLREGPSKPSVSNTDLLRVVYVTADNDYEAF